MHVLSSFFGFGFPFMRLLKDGHPFTMTGVMEKDTASWWEKSPAAPHWGMDAM